MPPKIQKHSFFSTNRGPQISSHTSLPGSSREQVIDLDDEPVDQDLDQKQLKSGDVNGSKAKVSKGKLALVIPQCLQGQAKSEVDYSIDNNEPTEWPSHPLSSYMTSLEQELLCPICSEFFCNPHTLLCGHSFCSLCIRRHLDNTINPISFDSCPCCREKAEAFDLRVNLNLIHAITSYKKVRFGLFDLFNLTAGNKAEIEAVPFFHQEPSVPLESPSVGGTRIKQKLSFLSTHDLPREKIISLLEKLSEESQVKFAQLEKMDKKKLEVLLKSFTHLVNAQIGSLNPLTLEQVIRLLNTHEKNLALEKKKENLNKKNFFGLKTNFDQEQRAKLYRLARDSMKKTHIKKDPDVPALQVQGDHAPPLEAMDVEIPDPGEGTRQNLSQFFSQNLSQYLSQLGDCPQTVEDGDKGDSVPDPESQSGSLSTSLGVALRNSEGSPEFKTYVDSISWVLSLKPEDFGAWRVVLSQKVRKLFFYNSQTSIGQFLPPDELLRHATPEQRQTFLELHFGSYLESYRSLLQEAPADLPVENEGESADTNRLPIVVSTSPCPGEEEKGSHSADITSQDLLDSLALTAPTILESQSLSLNQVSSEAQPPDPSEDAQAMNDPEPKTLFNDPQTESCPDADTSAPHEEQLKIQSDPPQEVDSHQITQTVSNNIVSETDSQKERKEATSDPQSVPQPLAETEIAYIPAPSELSRTKGRGKVFFNLELSQTEHSPLSDTLSSERQDFELLTVSSPHAQSPPDSPVPLSASLSPSKIDPNSRNNLFLFTQLASQQPTSISEDESSREAPPVPAQPSQTCQSDAEAETEIHPSPSQPFNQPWSCQYCTFHNTKVFNKCEVCENINPDFLLVNSKPRRSVRNLSSTPLSQSQPAVLGSQAGGKRRTNASKPPAKKVKK